MACLLSDHVLNPNAVFNVDGERDLKHEYLEIVELNGQTQGKISCFHRRLPDRNKDNTFKYMNHQRNRVD